jgi:UDP-glucose 4-epimerase
VKRFRSGRDGAKSLVTGGAGFVGSHLVDALVGRGDRVVVLDDLSTGRASNLEGALRSGRVEFIEGSTTDADLVESAVADADRCFHLASAVGVELIVDNELESLRANVRGAENVLLACAETGVSVLVASTSEVYGKHSDGPLHELSDRVLGPPQLSRWSYATAKSFAEALAYGLHRERGVDTRVARLFNVVGPRQTGAYGMVLPRFVQQAIDGEDLTVYGDGVQTRCFCHVADVVEALLLLIEADGAVGRPFNVGADTEISITELARRVIERSDSRSAIRFVPFEAAYGDGFEELGRRRPDTSALRALTGWEPLLTLEDAIDDVITSARAAATPAARREESPRVVGPLAAEAEATAL